MQWFQIKEQSAGKKRLILSWYLYKIFGKNVLYLIAFFVSFFTFIFSPKIREYSKKYFNVINLKPSLINQFKHILSYANSLVDKILVFCGDFNPDNIIFEDENDKNKLFDDISRKKGVLLICTHIGNIEVFYSYYLNSANKNTHANVFVNKKQGKIFAGFLETIKTDFPVKFFPVEEISLNTGIELKENLDKGEIVFIAGDRLAQDNDTKMIKARMFEHDILLPKGTFKLAKLMDVPTYFISAVKLGKYYKIYLEQQNDLSQKALSDAFAQYMEKVVKINPFQFFNFYDFFI